MKKRWTALLLALAMLSALAVGALADEQKKDETAAEETAQTTPDAAGTLSSSLGSVIRSLRDMVKELAEKPDIKIEPIGSDITAKGDELDDAVSDIIDNANSNSRAILDFLTQSKLQDLQSENQGLKLAASQAAQNSYLVSQLRPSPIPAYTVQNPYCCNQFAGCGC